MRAWPLRCLALAALGALRVEGYYGRGSAPRLGGDAVEPAAKDGRTGEAGSAGAASTAAWPRFTPPHEYTWLWESSVPPGKTRHPLWHFEAFQLQGFEVWACCVALLFAGILCSAGGIGGGGVYVTVLMVAGGLEISDAVPLSKAIVFMGSLSSLVLNLRKSFNTDESTKETLVDFNICRLVVPASIGGTYVGVFLNRILPSWVVGMVLTITLLAITIVVFRKTHQQYVDECDERKPDAEAAASPSKALASSPKESPASLQSPEAGGGDGVAFKPPRKLSGHRRLASTPQAPALESAPATALPAPEASRRYTWHAGPHTQRGKCADLRGKVQSKDCVLAIVLLCVVVLSSAFRFHAHSCANAEEDKVYEMCHHPVFQWLGKDTLQHWMHDNKTAQFVSAVSVVVPFAVCAAVVMYYNFTLIEKQGWQFKEVLLYDFVSVSTGALAGLVGIGGGLIISPFLLFMNLEPAVAVATSSTCVIFTASSTTFQYLLTDRIIMSLTLVYGLVNLLASYAGTSLVHMIQEKLSRRWYISAIVGAGVLVSTVLSLIQMVKKAVS